MWTIAVGPACLTYCGRDLTGEHKQSRTDQWQVMDKYYRGNTIDISLCKLSI